MAPKIAVDVTEAAPGVWFARARDVNWVLLAEGSDVVLVDAGYPGYADAVRESLDRIGRRWSDVVAVLVTHGHVDHVGSLETLSIVRDVPVYAGADELPNLRGERHESAGPREVRRHIAQRGVLPWAARIVRVGASEPVEVSGAVALDLLRQGDDGRLDLPGRPVPVATPGHTSGHTAYLLPDAGAVVSGDTLCTGHALSAVEGPQLLPDWFDHDRAGVVASLDTLAALDADLLLPGHGALHRAPMAEAVGEARTRLG